MKKILISLLVLACVAPTMAATTVDAAGGEGVITVTITVSDDDVVRGVAVAVEQAEGDTGDMAIALNEGAFAVDASAFNTFIDFAFSAGAGYTAVGQGHPVAQIGAAGEIAPAAGVQDFVISAGYLDEIAQVQGGLDASGSPYVITINMAGSADTYFDVSLDTLRGGIVGDNLEVTDNTAQVLVTFIDQEPINSAAPFYADWVAWGKPDCWAYAKNCKGDFDGLLQGSAFAGYVAVGTNDLNAFLPAFNIKEPPKGPGIAPAQICADFDHAQQGSAFAGYVRVGTNDLNILLANFNIKEPTKGPGIGDCAGPDYNYFVEP